jgi:hypothetical protein
VYKVSGFELRGRALVSPVQKPLEVQELAADDIAAKPSRKGLGFSREVLGFSRSLLRCKSLQLMISLPSQAEGV